MNPSRPATIDDVASAAGVSVATVSRALRGLDNVAASTRARVLEVAADLDYVVNLTAARLASGRAGSVAVAVPMFDTWYFSSVVAAIDAVVKDHGMDLLLYAITTEDDRERFLAGRGTWYQRGDALVLVDIRLADEQAQRLFDAGARIVTIGSQNRHFPSLSLNESESAATAARHLAELGHTRIGIISGDHGFHRFRVPLLREEGFRGALAEMGLFIGPELVRAGDFTVEGGIEAMADLMQLDEPPTAVFAMSDDMAIGAIAEARRRGLRIPDDVAVVGFDDNTMASLFDLTTVRQDVGVIGSCAGRLVTDLVGNPHREPEHVRIGTELVIRASTAGVPTTPGARS